MPYSSTPQYAGTTRYGPESQPTICWPSIYNSCLPPLRVVSLHPPSIFSSRARERHGQEIKSAGLSLQVDIVDDEADKSEEQEYPRVKFKELVLLNSNNSERDRLGIETMNGAGVTDP